MYKQKPDSLRSHMLCGVMLAAFALAYSAEALAGSIVPPFTAPPPDLVISGSATTKISGNTTIINQTSQKLFLDWTAPGAFNTTAGQTIDFVQPVGGIALNHITGGPTTFEGTLLATGQVWLINSNGILFGAGSTVNVGSLLASTAAISETNFNNSNYLFNVAGSPAASLVLDGASVTANGNGSSGGYIVLQAPDIAVQGGVVMSSSPVAQIIGPSHSTSTKVSSALNAKGGDVSLLAGQTFTADFNGDGLIGYQTITSPVSSPVPGAQNTIYVGGASAIHATTVVVEAQIYQNAILDHVINLGGQYESSVAVGDRRVTTYDQKTNPEGVIISGNPIVFEDIVANPVITPPPPPPPPPSSSSTSTTVPTSASTADDTIDGLTTTPTTSVYSASQSASNGASTNLSLLAPAGGGTDNGSLTNLGDISPAAGGDMASNQDNLGSLSPSAGGSIADAPSGISCANNYLDYGWKKDDHTPGCTTAQ